MTFKIVKKQKKKLFKKIKKILSIPNMYET